MPDGNWFNWLLFNSLSKISKCGVNCVVFDNKIQGNQSFLNISCSEERQKDPVTTSFFKAPKILTLSPLELVLSQIKAFLSSLGPSYIKPKR